MEEVVHVPESELFGREAEIVFSVDTSTEVSLIAENTVVPFWYGIITLIIANC